MNSNYIYFLEYTKYRCHDPHDPYDGANFRPIFISTDETKVIDLFNKLLEESKNKPGFEQNDDKSFYHSDNGDYCFSYDYRYRIQKFEMDKLIY